MSSMSLISPFWSPPPRTPNLTVERALDIVLSLAALIFLAPAMVILSAAIWIADGKGPFYYQVRVGQDGLLFPCFKFRTMCADADKRLNALLAADPAARRQWQLEHKLKDDPRITPIGNILRRTSIDELPQLWNVLRGDMSLVGPRPISPGEIHRYRHYFRFYCRVKPGLTGLWQISGRSNVSYRRRVAMDVLYIKTRTLGSYLKILIATVPAVLFQKGAA